MMRAQLDQLVILTVAAIVLSSLERVLVQTFRKTDETKRRTHTAKDVDIAATAPHWKDIVRSQYRVTRNIYPILTEP